MVRFPSTTFRVAAVRLWGGLRRTSGWPAPCGVQAGACVPDIASGPVLASMWRAASDRATMVVRRWRRPSCSLGVGAGAAAAPAGVEPARGAPNLAFCEPRLAGSRLAVRCGCGACQNSMRRLPRLIRAVLTTHARQPVNRCPAGRLPTACASRSKASSVCGAPPVDPTATRAASSSLAVGASGNAQRGQLRVQEAPDPKLSTGLIDSRSVRDADTVGRYCRGYGDPAHRAQARRPALVRGHPRRRDGERTFAWITLAAVSRGLIHAAIAQRSFSYVCSTSPSYFV